MALTQAGAERAADEIGSLMKATDGKDIAGISDIVKPMEDADGGTSIHNSFVK